MRMDGFFQNAYVTRDLDKAVALLRERHGIADWMLIDFATEVTTPSGQGPATMKVALGWVGDLQVELIQPTGGLTGIYSDFLPDDDSMRFHHVGMRVLDKPALTVAIAAERWPVAFQGGGEGFSFVYLDARDTLGHYLEYVSISQEMWLASGGR